jgi:tetratricopeptide (TPR) repeat protein
MKRCLVPGIPLVLSLSLSLFTVGSTVYWQDSGFFLAGVKEMGVLYPPGFVLYLVLCKAWTLVLGFLDFTLAVHLFSSFCASLAAAAIALASRDLLRSRGPLFQVGAPDGELAAIVAGSLAAAGYAFWSAALLAKGYALLYLILSLLLWRMIRADESGKGRDFTIVAVLIGLAWAAHPSATNLGLAFILFVAAHRRTLGGKGIAWRAGISAVCAIGPSLLLPLLALREPDLMFGHPASPGEWLRYLRGGAFLGREDVFGWESWRAANAMKYLWEDFLGVGVALALIGLARMATQNRKLLLGAAAWVVPSALIATLFKIEGQQDLWLVSAWLPLHLAVAVGFASFPGRYARIAVLTLGAAGLAWSVGANGRAVSMRGYSLAESFGRFHLENVEPGSILMLELDDTLATTQYLQSVKGFRRDVLVVCASRLDRSGWYARHLGRRHPGLAVANSVAAFADANVSRTRPVYFEAPPPESALRSDYALVPAGPLMKMVPRDGPVEPRAWEFPVRMEDLHARFGRERGIRLEILPETLRVEPEPYEHRWIAAFARAQDQQARVYFLRGGPENYRRAAQLFEAARAADPERPSAEGVHLIGVCYFLLNQYGEAEPALRQSLHLALTSRQRMRTLFYLATICRKQGRVADAARFQDQAMAVVGSDPELRREFEQYSRPK